MGQLLLFAENETFEQHVQAIIADKVRADAQLAQLGVCVLLNTVYDGFETGLTDAVVADVNELNGLVDLEHLTDRSRTVNIENVAVQVNALESLVLLHGVAEAHNAGDTEFAAAQVQVDQTLIEGEGRCEELGSLLVYGALPQVQLLDVAGAHRVLANRVGNELHVLLTHLAVVEVQDQFLALVGHFEEGGPDWLHLSQDLLGSERHAREVRPVPAQVEVV